MSAISSTTNSNLLSWLSDLTSQTQSQAQATANPADSLLASEAESASNQTQASGVPQSNILAAIAALGPFNSALQQTSGTQDALASFLGSLEQTGSDASAIGADAANATTSATAELSAIAASNDTTSQQAAISQLLSSDGVSSNQLQMDFLTAMLGSSNPSAATTASSGDIFSELSQNAANDSPLSILA